MITAYLSGNSISSPSSDAFSLNEKSGFGEKSNGKIVYMPSEALFLLEKDKISLYFNKSSLSFQQTLKKLKNFDKNLELKYLVYKNLRIKGYIPKAALKFGSDFRVYDLGDKPGKAHARWLVIILQSNKPLSLHDFAAKARIAHSTKKNLLFAIIDEESSISYYETNWKRL